LLAGVVAFAGVGGFCLLWLHINQAVGFFLFSIFFKLTYFWFLPVLFAGMVQTQ
jgi:hypothetical protein